MFEYKIQKAWEDYKTDFALGRSLLLISMYNTFLFFLYAIWAGGYRREALIPIIFALIFYFLRPSVIKLRPTFKLMLGLIPLAISIFLNYYLIGEFDRAIGFERKDQIFYSFDLWLFGEPVAKLGEGLLRPLGLIGSLFYDVLMTSYLSYFLLPIIGAFLIFKELADDQKHRIGRYLISVLFFFSLNYIFYMLVPVTGPQYWVPEEFPQRLPFTPYGEFLWSLINQGQSTFIDCFPSGHTGVAFLVTLWLFKVGHKLRYIFLATTLFIILATLMLRYHYLMDLICAFPLAYFSLKASWSIVPVSLDHSDL